MSALKYRSDINGLRAIAVIAVVIYHLSNSLLPGGFVGVDIFFVISGYLITKIIIREIEEGRFSFRDFYVRRIRRLFPALFLMLFVSILFAALTLGKEDMIWFAKTLRYSAMQISNLLFQKEVGYFDPSPKGNLLLHTWSLAVEEQFYLIWPLILCILFKFKKNKNLPFYGLIAISITSFIYSEYVTSIDRNMAFFAMSSRLWELGIGGILAFHKIHKPSKRTNEALGVLGIVCMIASFFVVDDNNFPGVKAILPCLGAALIIFSGHEYETRASKFLSNKIFMFFGLISYSLYLWHWPIIIFYKEYAGYISGVAGLMIFSSSIAISYLSYRYVEVPFRMKNGSNDTTEKCKEISIKPYHVVIIAVLCIEVLAAISINIKNSKGWEWRIGLSSGKYNDDVWRKRVQNCTADISLNGHYYIKDIKKCISGINKEKFEAVLFGDSYVDGYSLAVNKWAKKRGISLLTIRLGGCPPLIGERMVYSGALNRKRNGKSFEVMCSEFRSAIGKYLESYPDIKYVFFAARWDLYVDGGDTLTDSKNILKSKENTRIVFNRYMLNTLKIASDMDRKVMILGQVPYFYGEDPLECLQKYSLPLRKPFSEDEHRECISRKRDLSDRRINYSYQEIKNISSQYRNVSFFDPAPYFCDKNVCYAESDGKLLYADNGHLNIYGSEFMEGNFDIE